MLNILRKILFDEKGDTLAVTYSFSPNTLIVSNEVNVNFNDVEAVVNALTATNYANDSVGAAALGSDVVRANFGLIQHTDGSLYVDVSDTNPCLEISDGGLRVKVDGSTINRTANGLVASSISDHGGLSGLSDDDHSQYLNTTRHNSADHSGFNHAANGANSDITSLAGLTSLGKIAKSITWTGNGADNRNIAHGLGRTPVIVIISLANATDNSPILWLSGFTVGRSRRFADGAAVNDRVKSVNSTNVVIGTNSDVNQSGLSYSMIVI